MSTAGELVGDGWRIVFFRAGDRVAHRMERIAVGGGQPLLESAEGSPDQPWPTSPALQQVHFQPGPDGGQAALLVGMAGRSHWSASVEMSGDGSRAAFEVACRVKAPPAWLGTSYRMLEKSATAGEGPCDVFVGPLAVLSPGRKPGGNSAPTSSAPTGKDRGEPQGRTSPPHWAIGPDLLQLTVFPAHDFWPQTIAWRYVLELRR